MLLDANKTVREFAIEIPNATRVFERFKIDYCCGGNRTLTEASSSVGVDASEIIRLLEQDNNLSPDLASTNFQELSLSDLITHIVDTHHTFTREELERLDLLATKVIGAHGANHPELQDVHRLLKHLDADLEPHMCKEERVLFPYIAAMQSAAEKKQAPPFAPFGTVNNPVRMMMMEHDKAGDILRELRSLTSDYTVPNDACISYRTLYEALNALEKDLHQHIHLENNVLFPRAIELESEFIG